MSAVLSGVASLAAMHAVRRSIAEIGFAACVMEGLGDAHGDGIWYARDMRRLVRINWAILPAHPRFARPSDVRLILRLAAQLDAQPWEARVILHANLAPHAVVWRRLHGLREASALAAA